MNGKTAKLIRRYARKNGVSEKGTKKLWSLTPVRYRNMLRKVFLYDGQTQPV